MKLSVNIIAAALAASAIAAPVDPFQPNHHHNREAFPQPSLHLEGHHGPALEPKQGYSPVQHVGYHPPGPHHPLQDHQPSGSHAPVQPPNEQHRQQTNASPSPQFEAPAPANPRKRKARPKTEAEERFAQRRKKEVKKREEEGHAKAVTEWGQAVEGHKSAVALAGSVAGWESKQRAWRKQSNAAKRRLAEHKKKPAGWKSVNFNRSAGAAKKSQQIAEARVKEAEAAITAATVTST